jgi:hypothetical protein
MGQRTGRAQRLAFQRLENKYLLIILICRKTALTEWESVLPCQPQIRIPHAVDCQDVDKEWKRLFVDWIFHRPSPAGNHRWREPATVQSSGRPLPCPADWWR